jgi:hypothetical protein
MTKMTKLQFWAVAAWLTLLIIMLVTEKVF